MDKAQTIELIRAGKHDKVLKELYKFFPVFEKNVKRNSGTKQDAEDVFQDALIIFCEKIETPNFDFSSTPQTFLYGICKFLWANKLKRKPIEFDKIDVQEEYVDFDESENEKQGIAERIIQKLGEKCRTILEYFYVNQLSMQEIADKMNYSSAKIAKNQKYKCLEKARNQFLTKSLNN